MKESDLKYNDLKKEDINGMDLDSLFEFMAERWQLVQENHAKYVETKQTASGNRARKYLGELKGAVTAYRKKSIEAKKK